MTRRVRAKREKIQHTKYRGLLTQFIIFVVLRTIDLTASIAVLRNAWSDSSDWEGVTYTLFNTTSNEPRNITARSISPRRIVPRNINPKRFISGGFNPRNVVHRNLDHTTFEPSNFNPRKLDRPRRNPSINDPKRNPRKFVSSNVDPRSKDPPSNDPTNFNPRNPELRDMLPRRLNVGKTDVRRDGTQNIKRRSIDHTSADSGSGQTTEQCEQHIGAWDKKKMDSNISEYKAILGLTVFFNLVSMTVFLSHLALWVITLRITLIDGADYETRITRLTRNSLLSLATALIRDVPLSCLNVELLALRSGHEGLVCVACIFAGKCGQENYVENSLSLAKSLLYFNYFIMIFNSLWKGVSGFYRLSRFAEFSFYWIRACASIVFGFLYCIATFTPAMFMFIYRYFAIPGLNAPFLYDLASRLVVIGATIWVTSALVAICCPILYAIRLNAD